MKNEEQLLSEMELLIQQRDVVNNLHHKTDDDYIFVESMQEKINTIQWVLER